MRLISPPQTGRKGEKMDNKRDNYKFIIVGYGSGVYDYIFRDADKLPYAAYNHGIVLAPPARALMRMHLSTKVNRILPLPFRGIWGKLWVRQLEQRLDEMHLEGRTPCFVLLDILLFFERFGFSQAIRERFPQAKIVYYFTDLVALDPEKQKLLERGGADRILSFDGGDAQRYHLQQHNLPYSRLQKEYPDQGLVYDICLIAKAKERLPQILQAYDFLRAQGFRCGFWITEVPTEKRQYADQICYCDAMDYKDCLQIISKSKCILEIIQEGSTGNTLRVNEALEFNKVLITNNTGIVHNELYDPRYMFCYTDIRELDCDKIRQIQQVSYTTRDKISVENYLEDVAKALDDHAP